MFKPGLPTLLLVAPAYKSYRPILRPFFDSLPRPFSWKFDSGPRTQGSNKVGLVIDVLINVGQGWKTTGNEAYAKKDIALALESYTHGIEHLDYTLKEYGLKMKLDKSDTVRKLLAVFLANRAAVYLWDSKEFSPQKAEEDGRRSEDADPAYAKAYYRQARAHECLGDIAKARNVLNRALRREELKNDTGVRQELDKYLMMAM
ncbi:hypothetical protein OF83DRAFT_1071407 [Amylostereum chailletii]|nr:hypothetical protein OF83DRAFT_1071407 [Amylostereum chailletii]